MKKCLVFLVLQLAFACLRAQAPADTLFKYPNGQFLIKMDGRYELRDKTGVVEWWQSMTDYISLDNKNYHLIKRNGKTGLFQRREGKLILAPAYEQIGNFLQSGSLIRVKDTVGYFVYSIKTGNRTRPGFQNFRQFGKDCLAFNNWGLFIYNEQLLLTDSIGGSCLPASQVSNGVSYFMFLNCREQRMLIDDKYNQTIHNDWKNIVLLQGNLLVVESEKGQGVYHVVKNKVLTPVDHTPLFTKFMKTGLCCLKTARIYCTIAQGLY